MARIALARCSLERIYTNIRPCAAISHGLALLPAVGDHRWTISDNRLLCQLEVGFQAGLDTGSVEATVRGLTLAGCPSIFLGRVKSNISEGVFCTQKSRDTLPVGGGQIGSKPFGIIP